MDGGLGQWGAGGPVISYRRHRLGLLCPVMAVQKTYDWMVYVFNGAGIGSITVNLGKLQRPSDTIKDRICVSM